MDTLKMRRNLRAERLEMEMEEKVTLETAERDKLIAQIHLEEFKGLRGWLNVHFDMHIRLANLYIIGIGAVVGLTFSQFGHPLFPMLIAFATPYAAGAWLEIYRTAARVQNYIATHLHVELAAIVGTESVLGWELRNIVEARRRKSLRRLAPLAIFLFPALVSALGPPAYVTATFDVTKVSPDLRGLAWALCIASLVMNAEWAARWLRSPDLYESPQAA